MSDMKQGLTEWVAFYEAQGVKYNLKTLGKRRQISGIGELVGPRKRYIMTQDEFLAVTKTPLPMCAQVINSQAMARQE